MALWCFFFLYSLVDLNRSILVYTQLNCIQDKMTNMRQQCTMGSLYFSTCSGICGFEYNYSWPHSISFQTLKHCTVALSLYPIYRIGKQITSVKLSYIRRFLFVFYHRHLPLKVLQPFAMHFLIIKLCNRLEIWTRSELNNNFSKIFYLPCFTKP